MNTVSSSIHCFLCAALLCPLFLVLCACGDGNTDAATEKRVVMSLGKQINTLDPALAADTTSQYVCGAFYDTLLQYRYAEGEYLLEPCMMISMPEVSADGTAYTCTLRDDLYFQDGGVFANEDESARRSPRATSRSPSCASPTRGCVRRVLADPRPHPRA